jgi:hypothetical protein
VADLTREYRHLSICSKGDGPVADCHICRDGWEDYVAKHGENVLAPPRLEGQLVYAYREMSEHTKRECSDVCVVPRSCCTPAACDDAIDHAAQRYDIELKPTGHPKLPLMGPNGCIADPHLRPICTVHTCEINGKGFKSGPDGEAWTTRYFELRERIDDLEFEAAKYHADTVRARASMKAPRWEEGDIPGTVTRPVGAFTVTLGTSDSGYPPGTPEDQRLNLNTTALWMKVDVEDHEGQGYAFPLGWWAKIHSERSLHKAKGQIDRYGITLPPEMAAAYWQARVEEMETNLARAKRFCEEYLSTSFKPRLIETFKAIHEHQKTLGWSGEPK